MIGNCFPAESHVNIPAPVTPAIVSIHAITGPAIATKAIHGSPK